MKVLAQRVDGLEKAQMRELVDQLRGKLGSGVVVLGAAADGKVSLIVGVTKDLTSRVQAGKIVGRLRRWLAARAVGGLIWRRLAGVMWGRSMGRCRVRRRWWRIAGVGLFRHSVPTPAIPDCCNLAQSHLTCCFARHRRELWQMDLYAPCLHALCTVRQIAQVQSAR